MPFDANQFAHVCNVLRAASGDCTNGGLTAKHVSVMLIGPGGAPSDFDPKKSGLPVFRVVIRQFAGEPYYHAEPIEEFKTTTIGKESAIGPMFGGNFLFSSDSRFRRMFQYPIPAHDRFESESHYASNAD